MTEYVKVHLKLKKNIHKEDLIKLGLSKYDAEDLVNTIYATPTPRDARDSLFKVLKQVVHKGTFNVDDLRQLIEYYHYTDNIKTVRNLVHNSGEQPSSLYIGLILLTNQLEEPKE